MIVDIEKLEALAKAATPGRVHDRLDSCGGGLKYECFGDDGSLVLKVDHKNDEWGFVGERGEQDEAFFLGCTPAAVLELIDLYKSARDRKNSITALKAENAGLKTGYEAYERVNAGLRAECEDLKEKYEAARDRKNSITALQVQNEALRDAAAVSAMRIKELDLLFGRYILAMRAAVIEDENGKTDAGMDWIFNSLVGPGQLPPEGETDAQAYFDREIVAVDNGMQEVLAFHDQRRVSKSKEHSHD